MKTNFNKRCENKFRKRFENISDVKKDKVVATQIMGYDCNPGYARAKCSKIEDVLIFNENVLNKSVTENVAEFIPCSNVCKK